MPPTKDRPTFCWPRDHFQFELQLREGDGGYSVKAVPLPRDAQLPAPMLSARAASDISFNLSGVLGNNNGKFHWGRSFFEKTVKGVPSLEPQMDEPAPEDDSAEPEPESDPPTESEPESPSTESAPTYPSSTFGHVLKAYLLDLKGKSGRNRAQIDLHDKLVLQEYHLGGRTYHRLTEKDDARLTDGADVHTPRRTLVLCFDGTSNHFSDKNTNVVKLAELLKKDDPERQMVYYQTGVGTYSPPGLMTPIGLAVASALDQAVAWYLYQHVIDGYKFLMQTYRAGDKIALFGFSRGAFTARALAGMLHCVGLLPAHNSEHVSFAYQVYKNVQRKCEDPEKRRKILRKQKRDKLFDWLDPSEVDPDDFKKAFSVPVVIDFVGVWDTVASVGAVWMREFPWIEYNPSILIFRQALALDERRGNFIPSLWDHRRTDPKMQDAREVWFRGEHCDVGGGSAGPVDEYLERPKLFSVEGVCWLGGLAWRRSLAAMHKLWHRIPEHKEQDPGPKFDHSMLSNISLRWMVRQMLQFNTGILLDPVAVHDFQMKKILESPLVNRMRPELGIAGPPEKQDSDGLDKKDIQKDIYESIGWSPLWNVLEHVGLTQKPMKVMSDDKYHDKRKLVSATTRCPNARAGRSIYFATKKSADPDSAFPTSKDEGTRYPIYIHSSVFEYKGKYAPRATWYGYKDNQWPRIEFTAQSSRNGTSAPKASAHETSANELSVDELSVDETLDAIAAGKFKANTDIKIKRVPRPGTSKWPLCCWLKFVATSISCGCAILATVWLVPPGVIPKLVRVMLSLFPKSFFWL